MTTSPSPSKTPFITIWDGLTALFAGIIGFVMSIIHQETLVVSIISGVIVGVVLLVLMPVIRMLMNRPGTRSR